MFGDIAHPARLTAPHYERSEALTSIGGTEFNSPVDSLERTGRPRRSGLDRQCMALSDSSLLCSGKWMFPCIRCSPQRVASLSRWSGLALNNELFRPLRWGNGRGPVDPSGSASAPRASPGLSQSSDSHLPKGRGSSLVVIRPVCRGLERGVLARGSRNSGKCRGPCASDARLCPVWRSRFSCFAVCYSRATWVTLVRGARIQVAQLVRRVRIQKQTR